MPKYEKSLPVMEAEGSFPRTHWVAEELYETNLPGGITNAIPLAIDSLNLNTQFHSTEFSMAFLV